MLPELRAIFPLLRQSITFSKTLFLHLLLLNGITQTPILETRRVFQSLRKKYLQTSPNSFFHIHSPEGIKLITRLRLGLSHLREHKFKHSFQDTIDPLCNCGQDLLLTFSSTVPSLLMKDALSLALYIALIVNCWIIVPITNTNVTFQQLIQNFKQ